MLSRRQFLLTSFTFLATVQGVAAHSETSPALDPQFLPQKVDFTREYPVGTIVVDTANRFLYLIESKNIARRYGIGVGRAGKYARYADGVPGGPNNPLGSRALYLYRDSQDTLYRIHGTTEPSSIGKAVSNGCFRMLNEHVEDLFERVPVGAKVVVD